MNEIISITISQNSSTYTIHLWFSLGCCSQETFLNFSKNYEKLNKNVRVLNPNSLTLVLKEEKKLDTYKNRRAKIQVILRNE